MSYAITHIHPPFDPNCKVCVVRDRPGLDVELETLSKDAAIKRGGTRSEQWVAVGIDMAVARIRRGTALAEAQQREGAGSFDPRKPHGRVTPIKCPGCGQLVLYDDSRGGRHVPSTHRHPAQQREGAG